MEDEQKPDNDLGWGGGIVVAIIVLAIFAGISTIDSLPQSATNEKSTKTFYVKSTSANVRQCASLSCGVIGTEPMNTSFELSYKSMDELPEWVQISWQGSDGSSEIGYINKITLSDSQVGAASLPDTPNQPSPREPSSIPTNSPKTATKIAAEWRKRTAYIECDWNPNNDNSKPAYEADSGSGLLIKFPTGFAIATNKHVMVSAYGYGAATECYFKFPDDTGYYGPIKSMNFSWNTDGTDVGYLNIPSDTLFQSGLSSLTLSDRANGYFSLCRSAAQIGDPILILGYPSYGSAFQAVGSIEITATEGIISGRDGIYYTTSAKIEHGNSGGLAIDKQNDCYLGIPSAAVTGQIESLGRILPASYVLE